MNHCSICGKPIHEPQEGEAQCSVECGRQAYIQEPSSCMECNQELTYEEAFAGGVLCRHCIKCSTEWEGV